MKDLYSVDTDRVYLVGVSGGGHAALLMAGRSPEVWAGVSAWCGISDIAKWWRQTKDAGLDYCEQIEASCGGSPDDTSEVMQECRNRSPLTYLH